MSNDPLMSFADVAKEANIPLSTVYYLNAKSEGPQTVKVGRHLRVTIEEYEKCIQQNKK